MYRASSASPSGLLTSLLALPLGVALTTSAFADRIYLSDGSIRDGVDVQSETATTVIYKPAGSKKTEEVASELVLEIKFDDMPEAVATAEVDARSERFGAAVAGMEDYISNLGTKGDKKHPWAPAYAMARIVNYNKLGGDIPGMVAASDALFAANADSRYVPIARIATIDAYIANGDRVAASDAVSAFKGFVDSASLSQRWKYEADVRRILTDVSLKGEGLEKELEKISKNAATFPTVASFAKVAQAESMVSREDYAGAESVLRDVVEDPNAPDSTLAAAYTALGESLFKQSEVSTDEEAKKTFLEDAQLAFMRVVVNYKFEYGYVAKSAVFAGRTFQELGGPGASDNSKLLFRFVMRQFAGSRWAQEARDFDRKN